MLHLATNIYPLDIRTCSVAKNTSKHADLLASTVYLKEILTWEWEGSRIKSFRTSRVFAKQRNYSWRWIKSDRTMIGLKRTPKNATSQSWLFPFFQCLGSTECGRMWHKVTLRPLTASLGPDTRATRAFGNDKEWFAQGEKTHARKIAWKCTEFSVSSHGNKIDGTHTHLKKVQCRERDCFASQECLKLFKQSAQSAPVACQLSKHGWGLHGTADFPLL